MKILVTGGAGFIASHIVDAYIADGHEVVVIDNLSSGKRENLNPKAKFYEMDVCSPEVHTIFEKEKPEVLNHHAAQIDVRVSVADPLRDMNTNLGGIINLLEAGRKNGLKKVVFASSGGTVYGDQEVYPASEKHSLHPISPYGLNKLGSEQYLFFYERQYGIKWVALRYANVYGPRQSAHGEAGVVAIFIQKMLAGDKPVINGDGKQTRDYVFVGDVVKANIIALNEKAFGAYNVGTATEIDVNQVFRAIRELTGGNCEEIHVPAKLGETMRSSIVADRMKSEFGWTPSVDFVDGLKNTYEWFRGSKR